MATIDYKQKIKDYMNSSEVDTLYKSMLNNLFPELAESEDERIRKEIIKYLEQTVPHHHRDEVLKSKEWTAWLEKQGEPIDKIVKRAMNEKQRVLLTETNGDANIDWDTRSLQDVKLLLEYGLDYIKKLEKQGEQNPTDNVDPKDYNSIDPHFGKPIDKIEQKPDEWSEEGETRLTNIIIMLKEGASRFFIKDDITKAVDWLKSLRSQKQWKPRKEQMEAFATADLENSLCDIQNKFSDTSYEYKILGEAIEFIRCTEPKSQ